MTDLRERFRVLDELEVPDVMARAKLIGPKPPAPEPTTPVTRRIGALVFALGLAAVAVLLVVRSLDHTTSRPTVEPSPVQPSPVLPSPTIAPSANLIDISFVDIATGRSTPLPRSIRSLYGAEHFKVSPDGGRLAFDDGDEVYVANVDGTHLRRIAGGVGPSWSPDGRTLVYVSRGTLVLDEVTSGQGTRIFDSDRVLFHPNFSADGQQILFTAFGFADDEPDTMWTITATGGSAHPVPLPHTAHTYPAFGTYGPDGTTIAYRKTAYDTQMTQGTVWLADSDGSDPRNLGPVNAWASQWDAHALWPTWSPDGSRIAYERLYGRGVFIVDLSGQVTRFGDGSDPSLLDANTLIIQDYVPGK